MFHSSTRSTCTITRLLRTCNAQHRGNQSQRGRQVHHQHGGIDRTKKTGKYSLMHQKCRNKNRHIRWKERKKMYRSSLVRGPPGQSLRVDRRSRPPRHSTPSGGPAYELVGVRPRRKALPKAWAMKIGRDIKEGFPTDVKAGPSCTHFIDRKDRKKSTQERNAQRSTDAPPSLTAHIPSPFGKARFMEPVPISEGV